MKNEDFEMWKENNLTKRFFRAILHLYSIEQKNVANTSVLLASPEIRGQVVGKLELFDQILNLNADEIEEILNDQESNGP